MKKQGKYNFLKIQEIKIRNFSLYSKNNETQEVKETINNGVYCLAGANGLGKTTFLSLINYALTGLVLEPNKEVYSPSEIIKENKKYTERYFDGRIKSQNKEVAEIEITFKINNRYFRISRGFIDRETLNILEIYTISQNKHISLLNSSNKSPQELNSIYEKELTKDIGIGKFEYFIFLQLYVFTFDENKKMIFWDKRAATNALSISFNYDIEDTQRILELKREMEVLESYGRNTRWQATQIKNERNRLLATKREKELTNFEELKRMYDELFRNIEINENTFNNLQIEYDTLLKRQNIINSELLRLKIDYKKLFSQYSEPRSKLTESQYIKYSQKDKKCFLCGATGHYILENIEKNIYKDKCPICETLLDDDKDDKQSTLLKKIEKIDNEIALKNNNIEKLIFESEAKKSRVRKIRI